MNAHHHDFVPRVLHEQTEQTEQWRRTAPAVGFEAE